MDFSHQELESLRWFIARSWPVILLVAAIGAAGVLRMVQRRATAARAMSIRRRKP